MVKNDVLIGLPAGGRKVGATALVLVSAPVKLGGLRGEEGKNGAGLGICSLWSLLAGRGDRKLVGGI